MSSATLEIEPKHACKMCGKPFDPEPDQEICDDCQRRRPVLLLMALALAVAMLLAAGWFLSRSAPPGP